ANNVVRLTKTKLQGRRGADGALWVVGCQSDTICIGHGCDSSGFGQSADVRNVQLTNFTSALFKQLFKVILTYKTLTGGDGRSESLVNQCQPIDFFGPARFFEKIQAV